MQLSTIRDNAKKRKSHDITQTPAEKEEAGKKESLPNEADIIVTICLYTSEANDMWTRIEKGKAMFQVRVKHAAKPSVVDNAINALNNFLETKKRTNRETMKPKEKTDVVMPGREDVCYHVEKIYSLFCNDIAVALR